jgi:hypothetical protein
MMTAKERRSVNVWIADHWWVFVGVGVCMGALGVIEGPPYVHWGSPIPQGAVGVVAGFGLAALWTPCP